MSGNCDICKLSKEKTELKIFKCAHTFCWMCLSKYLKENLKIKNKCPNSTCRHILKDNEVRKILPEESIEMYDRMCLQKIRNSYKCILNECGTVSVYDDLNTQYNCSNCELYNCIQCQLAHKDMTCGQQVSPTTGQTLAVVCQTEMEAARIRLLKKLSELKRIDIAEMDKNTLLPNCSIFNCELCNFDIAKGDGVKLRNCFHQICRECLNKHVRNYESIPVMCPFSPCQFLLEDRECRESLNETEKANYESKSLARASRYLNHADNCRGIDCGYFCDVRAPAKNWTCPVCKCVNCVDCDAVHKDETCKQYMDRIKILKGEEKLKQSILNKELMKCLDCGTLLMKNGGCNWIPCSHCGVELCWIKQTYRWGPKGPGDTSGGCKCGVDGQPCHRDCKGCQPDIDRRHNRYLIDNAPVVPVTAPVTTRHQYLRRNSIYSTDERAQSFNLARPRNRVSDLYEPMALRRQTELKTKRKKRTPNTDIL